MAWGQLDREVVRASPADAEAYLLGAAHDSTYSRLHGTTRFCQADQRWLEVLDGLLLRLGARSWTYREGRSRLVWVLETSWRPPDTISELKRRTAYARGYFDAEGGIPRRTEARFYIQFVQKNLQDLSEVRETLLTHGIRCGRLHNPSTRVDPHYWRFFVASGSHLDFAETIRSWHPRKRPRLELARDRLSMANATPGLDRGVTGG